MPILLVSDLGRKSVRRLANPVGDPTLYAARHVDTAGAAKSGIPPSAVIAIVVTVIAPSGNSSVGRNVSVDDLRNSETCREERSDHDGSQRFAAFRFWKRHFY